MKQPRDRFRNDERFLEVARFFTEEFFGPLDVLDWLYLALRRLGNEERRNLLDFLRTQPRCRALSGSVARRGKVLLHVFQMLDTTATTSKIVGPPPEGVHASLRAIVEPYFNYDTAKCMRLLGDVRDKVRNASVRRAVDQLRGEFQEVLKFAEDFQKWGFDRGRKSRLARRQDRCVTTITGHHKV